METELQYEEMAPLRKINLQWFTVSTFNKKFEWQVKKC